MAADRDDDEKMDQGGLAVDTDGGEKEEESLPLELDVQFTSPSACERHVTVTISRADIDRYFDDAFGEMMPTAAVPGFRAGRAPRKIVESRFRDEVSEQVKSSLLLDSLEQISTEQRFTAISEPNFDLEAVEVPKVRWDMDLSAADWGAKERLREHYPIEALGDGPDSGVEQGGGVGVGEDVAGERSPGRLG